MFANLFLNKEKIHYVNIKLYYQILYLLTEVKTSELDKFTPAAVRRLIISLSSKRAFR